jgi:hypothetical protein
VTLSVVCLTYISISFKHRDAPEFVCKSLSRMVSPPLTNISLQSKSSKLRNTRISRDQVNETQSSSLPLKITGTNTYCHAPMSTQSLSLQSSERGCRLFVRLPLYSFLLVTESPAVLYNHDPVLQYLFMREEPCGRTSLLDTRR